jgi:hypothetical protein
MRIVGLLLMFCLGAAPVAGCKNKGSGEATADPEALKAQQELIARRDKLLDARKKLQAERDKIDLEIKDIESKGGDAAEQIKKRAELDTQLETSTSDLISMVNGKLDAMKQSSDKSANVAGREAEIASRERAVADREARIAERERALTQRDFESAQRWKDSCNTGAAPLIIQQAAPKSGKYTNSDVTALIQKAKSAMSRKGLINSDLPGPSQGLEGEASKAINDGDTSKAYFAAAQLVATVDAIQVNRAFIQAKMARISAQVKTAKAAGSLDEAANKELATILGDVMQKYNDGDFGAANKRLNNLAAKLK